MRLAFNIALILAAFIVGLVIVLWLYFVHTPPGREFLKTRAESAAQQVVRDQLQSELAIGELENGLPGRIALNDVVLSADGEDWFRAERVVMVWNPFALLNRKVLIRDFTLEEADLLALPPERPDTPDEEEPDEPFSLPQELPWIDIKHIRINPLRLAEGIAGDPRTIRAEGRFSTANNRISSDLTITTGDNDDLIHALIGTRRNILTLDLQAEATPDGLINHYAQAGGPMDISLQGEGALEEWSGNLVADAAAWGAAELDFVGDLSNRDSLSLTGTVSPGAKWPEAAAEAVGSQTVIDVGITTERRGRILRVTTIEGAFGMLQGELTGIQDNGTIDNGAIEMVLDLSPNYADSIGASPLAGQNRLAGTLSVEEDGAISADGQLNTPSGRINFRDLAYDDDGFNAYLTVLMDRLPLDDETVKKLFPRGGQISARVSYADDQVSASEIDLFSGPERANASLTMTGNGAYDLETERVSADGQLMATPQIIARFTETVSFEGPVRSRFDLSGTPDNLALTLDSDYASGVLSGQTFASGTLSARFSGLPGAPQGNLNLSSSDNSYRGGVTLEAMQSDDIVARDLTFRTPQVSIAGRGRVNPQTRAAEGNLSFDAGATASIANNRIAGTAQLSFNVVPQGEALAIESRLTGNNLSTDQGGIETIVLTVNGTDQEMDIVLDAENVLLPNKFLISELDNRTALSLAGEEITARINSLVAKTGAGAPGQTVSLTAPATIRYADSVVTVSEANIDSFGRSTISLSGQYGPERWVLDASGTAVRVPGLQSPLTFEIDLDTDREMPGTITLTGEVQDQNDELHRLTLNGEWNGDALVTQARLRDQDSDYPGQLDLTIPLTLVRGDSLSIATGDGAIDGQFTYDAGVENILAFLPIDENYLTGQLVSEIDIAGTIARPQVDGEARLVDGRFEEPRAGAVLDDMQGTLTFSYGATGSEGQFTINAADATGRADAFNMQGSIVLGDAAGAEGSAIEGTLALDRATVIQSQNLSLTASSNLELSGTMREMLLAGNIDILNLDAVIPDVEGRKSYTTVEVVRVNDDSEQTELEQQQTEGPKPLTVNLDIDVSADNEIYINGRGLTSEWQTNLAVTGTATSPVLVGQIQTVDGTFEFGGRNFDITTGRIIFTERNALNPRLDIEAQYEADTAARGAVTAIIRVTGMADEPNIQLTSNPSLPQEDVMALVLFGKDPGQLSAYESLQIARSIAALTATGPFGGAGITNSLRRSAGLDTLSFGQDSETGAGTLTVGKYVSDDVYVSATQGLGEAGNSVSVTYEVSDHVTVETTVESTGAQSVSANYKRDY